MTHERRHRIGSQRAWPVFLGFCLLISLGCSQSTKRKAIEGTVTQILPPLDFLAEFTQHIPAKGSHLIRPRSLLKRRLVLQQVAGHAQEGGSGSIRRAIERGRFRRGTSPL